jgi:nitrogen regulatory protein PII
MEIEPEKEIVLIISEEQLTEAIAGSIKEELKIDEPGNGVIFIQEVNKTYGLY